METLTTQNRDKIGGYWFDKRVLITGGTAGLGKQLAKFLTTYGAHVAVIGRNLDRLEAMKKEIDNIITIQGDISNKEDIHKVTGQAIGLLGQVDILINNASSLGIVPLANLIDTPCENFLEALETNLLGPFRLIKAILPSMVFKSTPLIINISSDAAVSAYPTWGIYSVTKAALDHLTKIWAKELQNITFLAIDPGDMYTQMQLDANPDANEQSFYDPKNVASDLSSFIALSDNNFAMNRYSASEWREILS